MGSILSGDPSSILVCCKFIHLGVILLTTNQHKNKQMDTDETITSLARVIIINMPCTKDNVSFFLAGLKAY